MSFKYESCIDRNHESESVPPIIMISNQGIQNNDSAINDVSRVMKFDPLGQVGLNTGDDQTKFD